MFVVVVVCYTGEINNLDLGFSPKSTMLLRAGVGGALGAVTRNKPLEWASGDCMIVQLNGSLYKIRIRSMGIPSSDVSMMGEGSVLHHTAVALETARLFKTGDFGVKGVTRT